jgi:hypothetical protein
VFKELPVDDCHDFRDVISHYIIFNDLYNKFSLIEIVVLWLSCLGTHLLSVVHLIRAIQGIQLFFGGYVEDDITEPSLVLKL